MHEIIQLIAAWLGSLGFAALFNLRGKKLVVASLGGIFAWAVYLGVEKLYPNPYLCGFAASVMLTLYAECMARIYKTPVTVFLAVATIPLIPGAGLYRTMNCLMQQNWDGVNKNSTYTVLFATSLCAGMMVTTVIFRSIWNGRHRFRRL